MITNSNATGLVITPEALKFLDNIAKWTKFLSIVIFIALALSAIFILLSGVLITGMNAYAIETNNMFYTPGVFSWGYATFLLLTLVVYAVPNYYLFKFSSNLRGALRKNDTARLTLSLHYLQQNFKFIGVITLILLVLFLVLFLVILGSVILGM